MDPKEEKNVDKEESLDILIEQMSDVALLLEAKIKQDKDLDNSEQLDIMIEQFSKLEKTLTTYLKQEKDDDSNEESDIVKSIQRVEKVMQDILEHEMKPEEKEEKDYSMMKHHEAMMKVLSDIKILLSKEDVKENIKEGPEDVNIIGSIDIKEPKWYESFMYDEMALKVGGIFSKLILRVRMVDDKGNPINNLGGGDGKTIFAGSNAPEVVGIKDKTGNQVNIVTEETVAGLFSTRLDKLSQTNIMYVGKAAIGANPSNAVWRIFKVDKTNSPVGLIITWADGNSNFDNIWDNRLSLTYI